MKHYTVSQDLEIIEKGNIEFLDACKIIDDKIKASKEIFRNGERCVSETFVGFYKSNTDFIELSFNGDSVLLHTDVLGKLSFIDRLLRRDLDRLITQDDVKGIVKEYYLANRFDFEKMIKNCLTRR